MRSIMRMAYLWLLKTPTLSIVTAVGSSTRTVCAFTTYYRQLVQEAICDEETMIGGEGIVVELDECKH